MRTLIAIAPLVLACACQPTQSETETPTEPETGPIEVAPPGGMERSGTPAFVGIWAAEPEWCLHPSGDQRPIQLTETRFQGYENTCEITNLTADDVGWTATFTCAAEGQVTSEPVAIEADAQTLEINWIEQGGQSVEWRRCPA